MDLIRKPSFLIVRIPLIYTMHYGISQINRSSDRPFTANEYHETRGQLKLRFVLRFFQASGLRRFVHYAFMSFRRPFLIDKRYSVQYVHAYDIAKTFYEFISHQSIAPLNYGCLLKTRFRRTHNNTSSLPGGRTLNRRQEHI